MSRRGRMMSIGTVPLALAAALWLLPERPSAAEQPYRFAAVARDTVEAVVSATGTLSAVTTVQVGTQVSGQVTAILADFNDAVAQGQLLARIDPTLQQQAVREADASLARSRAELQKARDEHARAKQLHDSRVITDADLSTAEYQLAVAEASVRSAQVSLERARRNLAYTEIYSPIAGTVVERNVDVGQTVAASLSAPQLFLIAQDLSEMQILASVDEGDIAQIREGAPVRFTVQAYPESSFRGNVRQVRLQSTTQENVVSYTAVVAVQNPDGKLLPGMTATVEFLTASAENVLAVPNAALRFRPPAEQLATASGGGTRPGSGAGQGTGEAVRARTSSAARPANAAQLWYLDGAGALQVAGVRTGLTDGQLTEVSGEGLREGMQVIVGMTGNETAGAATNPFQAQGRAGGPPAPGGF